MTRPVGAGTPAKRSDRPSSRLPRGAWVAIAVALAALLVAVAGGRPGRDGPPLDPRSDGPLGTSALVSLLEGLGAHVELGTGLPEEGEDVALLLRDRLDDDQRDAITGWVRAGGTLVVTDPSSLLAPLVAEAGVPGASERLEPGRCTIGALAAVGAVEAGSAVAYEAAGAAGSCFGGDDAAYVVLQASGAGEVVAVGGAALITNDMIAAEDNAVLAAALLAPAPGTVVRVVDPPVPAGGGDRTLADLVAPGSKRAGLQLGIAFVLYALWRAVRVGRPVDEGQAVEIAGSELVAATGRLLSRARDPQAAAVVLQADLRRRLQVRLGVPADAPPDAVAAAVAARAPVPVEAVRAALDERPVTNDEDLVAVARAVAALHQEVLS